VVYQPRDKKVGFGGQGLVAQLAIGGGAHVRCWHSEKELR
jgi:hypothetical protein